VLNVFNRSTKGKPIFSPCSISPFCTRQKQIVHPHLIEIISVGPSPI
jgi:hypothetical protein